MEIVSFQLIRMGQVGPVGGQTSVGGVATLLSSHAGRSITPGIGKTHERQPQRERQGRYEPDTR
ncbi:hypothetical protein GCM10009776_38030 [Microbacterium deminutum]|uniref:Uncharacterized protein n=1 Tax=Microbacterium deminutum TaxID=344164 RepID=A0ABN2RMI6_9MICO